MKLTELLLAIGLICIANSATAADMKVDLNIPGISVQGLQGNGQPIALRVEDGRSNPRIGVNLDGDPIVLDKDAAAAVMASFTSSLRAAGFRLESYNAASTTAILIRIQSLNYSSEKAMVTSTAHLGCKMIATLSRAGSMVKERTLGTSGEYTLTWRPNQKKISELVSSTIGDTVQAILQDTDTASFLMTAPQQ